MIPSTLYMNTKNNNSVHMFDTLFIGKHYKFSFTHRSSCVGVVCEVNKSKQTIVVCDIATNSYELVPIKRLLSCESISR